jgi:hypothetical protein
MAPGPSRKKTPAGIYTAGVFNKPFRKQLKSPHQPDLCRAIADEAPVLVLFQGRAGNIHLQEYEPHEQHAGTARNRDPHVLLAHQLKKSALLYYIPRGWFYSKIRVSPRWFSF